MTSRDLRRRWHLLSRTVVSFFLLRWWLPKRHRRPESARRAIHTVGASARVGWRKRPSFFVIRMLIVVSDLSIESPSTRFYFYSMLFLVDHAAASLYLSDKNWTILSSKSWLQPVVKCRTTTSTSTSIDYNSHGGDCDLWWNGLLDLHFQMVIWMTLMLADAK